MRSNLCLYRDYMAMKKNLAMNDVWLTCDSINIFIHTVKKNHNKISENVFSNNLILLSF